mmetsp:Transcript_21286/g.50011  ORF Transcript_21286/g.50011 Transcript_21286/m.50011 type:complete len:531 (+) Transcript_21286:1033-2625(+)
MGRSGSETGTRHLESVPAGTAVAGGLPAVVASGAVGPDVLTIALGQGIAPAVPLLRSLVPLEQDQVEIGVVVDGVTVGMDDSVVGASGVGVEVARGDGVVVEVVRVGEDTGFAQVTGAGWDGHGGRRDNGDQGGDVEKAVGGAGGDAGNRVGDRGRLDGSAHLGRGVGGVGVAVQSSGTSNCRSGHGGTGEDAGSGVGGDTGRDDIAAGGDDIDTSAGVGEGREVVRGGRGTHGNGIKNATRGPVAGVGVVVPCSNGHDSAASDDFANGIVEGVGGGGTEGKVDHRGAAGGLHPLERPFKTGKNGGVRAEAIAVQNLNRNQMSSLGDTKGVTADGGSDMGAVSVAIIRRVTGNERDTSLDARTKLGVGGANAGVEDVGIDAAAIIGTAGVECAAQGKAGLIQTVQGPRDGRDGDLGVLLDVGCRCALANGLESCGSDTALSEALENVAVDPQLGARASLLDGSASSAACTAAKLDDVATLPLSSLSRNQRSQSSAVATLRGLGGKRRLGPDARALVGRLGVHCLAQGSSS